MLVEPGEAGDVVGMLPHHAQSFYPPITRKELWVRFPRSLQGAGESLNLW